jgi:hypothetical protein
MNEWADKFLKGKNAKYLVLMCVGIMLLIASMPIFGKNSGSGGFDSYTEKRLKKILCEIEGVGDVDVMITSKNNVVEGVIIVAGGAEINSVKNNIYNAAVAALGVQPHKIEIFVKKGGGRN